MTFPSLGEYIYVHPGIELNRVHDNIIIQYNMYIYRKQDLTKLLGKCVQGNMIQQIDLKGQYCQYYHSARRPIM